MVKIKSAKAEIDDFLSIVSGGKSWNSDKHDREAKLDITKMFLWFFFLSGLFVFLFCFAYNAYFTYWAGECIKHCKINETCDFCNVELLNVLNVISAVTTALGTALGFIIGYYFKDKQ